MYSRDRNLLIDVLSSKSPNFILLYLETDIGRVLAREKLYAIGLNNPSIVSSPLYFLDIKNDGLLTECF